MASFQNFARNELGGLRSRVQVMDQRVQHVYMMRSKSLLII